jgi:hypothetical protein
MPKLSIRALRGQQQGHRELCLQPASQGEGRICVRRAGGNLGRLEKEEVHTVFAALCLSLGQRGGSE